MERDIGGSTLTNYITDRIVTSPLIRNASRWLLPVHKSRNVRLRRSIVSVTFSAVCQRQQLIVDRFAGEALATQMHTLGDLAKKLNRPAVHIRGLQDRFGLPVFGGSKYSDAYLAFLKKIVFLRTLSISEDRLKDLWALERKLMQLLHVDSTGSQTWFLDSCLQTKHRDRRLLLSHYDLGVPLPSVAVQLGLNFDKALPELFAGTEMGEDSLRVLRHYLKLHTKILADVADELPQVKAAARWGRSSTSQV